MEEYIGKVLNCSQELITVISASKTEDGFAIRLSLHPNGVLGTGLKSALQEVPLEALDEESARLLEKYSEDSKAFIYAPRSAGGNVYTLRLTEGYIRFDELVERVNPTTGETVLGFGGFTHSHLKVARLGAAPAKPKFDPNLGLTAPAPAPAAPALATPAPAKAAAKRR